MIRSLGLEVERDPKDDDPGHCNIAGRKTRGKAQGLARSSRWVPGYEPTQPRIPHTPRQGDLGTRYRHTQLEPEEPLSQVDPMDLENQFHQEMLRIYQEATQFE